MMNGEMDGQDGFHILPTVLHPYSRGSVRLASTDPFQPPIIEPGYLTDGRDVTVLIEGQS